jgi:hypothetical protein
VLATLNVETLLASRLATSASSATGCAGVLLDEPQPGKPSRPPTKPKMSIKEEILVSGNLTRTS